MSDRLRIEGDNERGAGSWRTADRASNSASRADHSASATPPDSLRIEAESCSTTRLWTLDIEVTFQADDEAEAEAMAAEITGGLMDHEAVWSANGHFEPEQTTETVDV